MFRLHEPTSSITVVVVKKNSTTWLVLTLFLAAFEVIAQSPEQIEKITEIFFVKKEFLSPYDRVLIKDGTVFLQVWRDQPADPDPARVECLGYQWLLTGRGQNIGEGAPRVFREFPEIHSVQLDLIELEFSEKSVDGRGKLAKEAKPKTYLRLAADRAALSSMNTPARELKKQLQSDTKKCVDWGRQFIRRREITL
jgi:hypothetical protein